MNYYLGLDLGTSSIKAVVMSDTGKVMGTCSKPVALSIPKTNFAEQDSCIWWETIQELLSILSNTIDLDCIRGIGISGQMHGLVMYDKSLRTLGNAIVWLDKRSEKQVLELKETVGEKKLYKITGNPLFTGFLFASLLWVKENDTQLYAKIHLISSPKDFIAYKLTDILRTEPTDALATGVYDYHTNTWSEQLLKKAGISPSIFPHILPTTSAYGKLTPEAANLLGLPAHIPVFGGSDQSMAALGVGLIKEKQASLAISTGGQFLVVGKKGIIDSKRRLHTLHHALEPIGLYMGATLTAGLSLEWFKTALFGEEHSFDQLLAGVTADPVEHSNLFFLPFLAGERTPYFNPNLKGAFIGLTLSHKKQDFVKAVFEGVGFSMKECLEVFNDINIPIEKIILSGGGTKHRVWAQTIANVLDMPIEIINIENHSPYGAAILAKFSQENFIGIEAFYKKIIKPVVIITPNKKYTKTYKKLFEQYKQHAQYLHQEAGGICLK